MDITQEYSELFSSLVALIRSSNSLYSFDVDFVRSLNRDFSARSENASHQLLHIINELTTKCNGGNSDLERPLNTSTDVEQRWNSIEQTFDLLSDKIDLPPKSASKDTSYNNNNNNNNAAVSEKPTKDYMRLSNNIPKPQLGFSTKVDNSIRPFKPLLTQKPFATQLSLSQSLLQQPPDESHAQVWYEQPYKQEISKSPYPIYDYSGSNEMPDWDSTPFTFVDSPKKLFKMVSKLEKATEIAVDVEHHDYRSYLGLVCLLQISGLGEDYVIDALALRSELQVLNKVFANSNIIKVFHGAKMDIMWLQRDLGVYVVGLFDTYFAARELQFPKLSLAYMLQEFAGFQAQKKYQLADWRLRPLPEELMDYARADTHFLLYIYHQLRQKLQETGQTQVVLEESRKVASYRYEYPGWNEAEPAWVPFAFKYRLNGQLQRAILVKLFEWRDQMARKYDESTRYIMAPQFLANLCVTKPSTAHGVLLASHNVSPIVRKNAEKLAELIQDVCADPDSVDTAIPEPIAKSLEITSQFTPPGSSTLSITDLKLNESALIGPSQLQITSTHIPLQLSSPIPLGVITPKELEQVHALNTHQKGEGVQGTADDGSAMVISEELENTSEQQPEDLPQNESESTSGIEIDVDSNPIQRVGKKLNVVDSTDEYDLTLNISRPNTINKPLGKEEPAFDFNNAPKIIQSSSAKRSGNSYSQFGAKARGPRGVSKNTSKFKNAKSLRR